MKIQEKVSDGREHNKSDSHIEGISKDNLTYDIWKSLGLKEVSPRQLSPLVLAYIGDSIFDLVVKL